jgi:hypothetical protein
MFPCEKMEQYLLLFVGMYTVPKAVQISEISLVVYMGASPWRKISKDD